MSYDRSRNVRRGFCTRMSVLLGRCCGSAVRQARACTFWLAIGLPWLLLGLTFGGYVTANPRTFAGLLAVAVVCGVVGRNHAR